MRNSLFSALIVCFSVFAFDAYASESALDMVSPAPEMLSREIVTTSGDLSVLDITEKNLISSVIPASTVVPSLSKKSVGNTGSTNSTMTYMQAAAADTDTDTDTGPGTGPNTAPYFSVGGYYQDALASTGAQHWFYTQADRNGQMTIHLDVPASTAVDYDLYIYQYEPSTGYLYTFQNSLRYPGAAEHLSFTTTTGSYYFIHVQSYQGGGSSMFYVLHIDMAAQGVGEIDDFPENARTLTPVLDGITSETGRISMRTDEDFFKFTAVGTGSFITFIPTNTNIVADVYRLNGTTLNSIGLLPEPGCYSLSTTIGDTYYLHVRSANNTIGLTSDYDLRVNSFNNSNPDRRRVGSNFSGSEVLYVENKKLYSNSSFIMNLPSGGLEELCHYHFQEPDDTDREAKHDSFAASPVTWAYPISYSISGGGMGVSSMSNALAIYVERGGNNLGVHCENWKYSNQNPYTGETHSYLSRYYQNGYASGAFILDLSDNKVKDFASSEGNGFYNGYFDNYSFVITKK
jgi:hypothetical protein